MYDEMIEWILFPEGRNSDASLESPFERRFNADWNRAAGKYALMMALNEEIQ